MPALCLSPPRVSANVSLSAGSACAAQVRRFGTGPGRSHFGPGFNAKSEAEQEPLLLALAAPEVEPDLAFIPAERGVPQDIQDLFRHEAWARAMGVGRWFCCRRRRLARTLDRWARLYRHLRRLRRLQRVFAFAGHHLAATYPRSLLRRLRAVW